MNCPHCDSENTNKNGTRNGKQNYICKDCRRQFLESYSGRGYSIEVRKICIRMRENGMKYREIERLTGVSHNTVILWMQRLGDASKAEESDQSWLLNPFGWLDSFKSPSSCGCASQSSGLGFTTFQAEIEVLGQFKFRCSFLILYPSSQEIIWW